MSCNSRASNGGLNGTDTASVCTARPPSQHVWKVILESGGECWTTWATHAHGGRWLPRGLLAQDPVPKAPCSDALGQALASFPQHLPIPEAFRVRESLAWSMHFLGKIGPSGFLHHLVQSITSSVLQQRKSSYYLLSNVFLKLCRWLRERVFYPKVQTIKCLVYLIIRVFSPFTKPSQHFLSCSFLPFIYLVHYLMLVRN